MPRVAATLVAALLLAGGPAAQQAATPEAAVPFWEEHDFETWSVTELLQLLTDSPWSHPATLVTPGGGETLGKTRYYAEWYSAQTVREALVRQQHVKGNVDSAAEGGFLNAPRTAYQIYLCAGFFTESGGFRVVPLEAFAGMTREELQEGTRLSFSSQEHASRPDKVELVRNSETQELVGIRLSFERARAAVPPEEAREGQVRLVCPTRGGTLSVSFLLNQMRRGGRPDL